MSKWREFLMLLLHFSRKFIYFRHFCTYKKTKKFLKSAKICLIRKIRVLFWDPWTLTIRELRVKKGENLILFRRFGLSESVSIEQQKRNHNYRGINSSLTCAHGISILLFATAEVAELADAYDSNSYSLWEWGFDSLLRHSIIARSSFMRRACFVMKIPVSWQL